MASGLSRFCDELRAMSADLIPTVVIFMVWNAAFVVAVRLLRARAAGRVLVVLGTAAAGICLALISVVFPNKAHQGGGGEPGFGGWVDLFERLMFVTGPLALLGASLGTWLGVRWSREPALRVRIALGSAALSALSIVVVALLS